MILSNITSALAWFLFYQEVKRQFTVKVAKYALIALIVFPGSLFFQFIYSESLFFLLVVGLWMSLARNLRWSSFFCAFFLPLTRPILSNSNCVAINKKLSLDQFLRIAEISPTMIVRVKTLLRISAC